MKITTFVGAGKREWRGRIKRLDHFHILLRKALPPSYSGALVRVSLKTCLVRSFVTTDQNKSSPIKWMPIAVTFY